MTVFFILSLGICGASPAQLNGHLEGFGSCELPATDFVYDSYAFVEAQISSPVGASFGDYAVVDDFPWSSATVRSYTCWGVTTQAAPTELRLLVVLGGSSYPDGAPVSQNTYPIFIYTTGWTFAGYPIYMVEINLGAYPLNVQESCWLGSHRNDGSNWYPLAGTVVTGHTAYRTTAAGWSWQEYSPNADLFKIITDVPPTALGRNTWAGIKQAF